MSASQSPPATGSTGVAPSAFVGRVRSRIGAPYRVAGEWAVADPSPVSFRPAELVAWAAARLRSRVPLAIDPVGLYWQCVDAGTVIERGAAASIEGALLFRFATTSGAHAPPRDRAARRSVVTAEVAVTTGEGDLVHVDLAAGVVRALVAPFAATHAALVPGLEYPSDVAPLAGRIDALGRDAPGFRMRADLPWLREGVRGNAVATAQALLIAGGSVEQARLGPTGTFDSGTARAVTAFQQRVRSEHGAMLPVDGSIGPATWGWLFVYAGATADGQGAAKGVATEVGSDDPAESTP
jgi:hypothetical protein